MNYRLLFALAIGLTLSNLTVAFAADAESLPGGEARKRPIAETCLKDIQAFEEQLWRVGFGVLPYGVVVPEGDSQFYRAGVEATPRKEMRTLRNAAYLYAYAGDELSCQQTLASMRTVYDEHQKLLGKEAGDPNARMAWRRAHLARARPVAEMDHLIRAGILIGSEIRNLKDERLGEITDVVLNPERRDILYVLASRGGFLGFGGKVLAIRWTDLRATEDHEMYVLDVAPKAFDAAPAVDRANFTTTADPEWQRSLNQYWDGVFKK